MIYSYLYYLRRWRLRRRLDKAIEEVKSARRLAILFGSSGSNLGRLIDAENLLRVCRDQTRD